MVVPTLNINYKPPTRPSMNAPRQETEEDNPLDLVANKFLVIGLVFSMTLFGPAVVNLYSGQGYLESVLNVMTERTWKSYTTYMVNDSKAKFKSLSWIF